MKAHVCKRIGKAFFSLPIKVHSGVWQSRPPSPPPYDNDCKNIIHILFELKHYIYEWLASRGKPSTEWQICSKMGKYMNAWKAGKKPRLTALEWKFPVIAHGDAEDWKENVKYFYVLAFGHVSSFKPVSSKMLFSRYWRLTLWFTCLYGGRATAVE